MPTESPATRGTSPRRQAGPPAARRPPWRRELCPGPPAPTGAARAGSRRPAAGWGGCSPHEAGSRVRRFSQRWRGGVSRDRREVPGPGKLERVTRQAAKLGGRVVSQRGAERLRLARRATAARMHELGEEVDVLITPGLASTAIPAEGG